MDDKKNEVLTVETNISSSSAPPIHEESNTNTNCVSQPNADNLYKKNVTTDTDCGPTIDVSCAQDTQDATKVASTSIDDADFSLQMESSDEDTLNEPIDTEGASKGTKIDEKSAISKKPETLFSDIESSDDSIVYEPKSKSAVSVATGSGGQSVQKGSPATDITESLGEVKKVIESEFDLVESDEEFFEDLPLPEKTEPLPDATAIMEEEERSSTPLIDEENDSSTEIDLNTEGVNAIESNLELAGSQSTAITSDHSMDLMLESSAEMPELIAQDSTDTLNSITNNQDLADDKSAQVDDEETLIGSNLIPEVLEEAPSKSSLLLEENEEHPTTKIDSLETDLVTSESSKQSEDKSCGTTINSLQVSPDKKSDKVVEDLPNVDSESSETSQKIQEVPHSPENIPMSPTIPDDEQETEVEISNQEEIESSKISKEVLEVEHDPENIPMSPTLLEEENIAQSVQPEIEAMETDVELTEETNLDGDEKMEEDLSTFDVNDSFASENEKLEVKESPTQINETILEVSDDSKIEEDQSILEVNDSFASENEKPKVEEPTMQIDETILDISEVSEMETIKDDTTVEKTNNQTLHQNESQKSPENEEHIEPVKEKKSDEAIEENKEVAITVENVLDIDVPFMNKPIEKSIQSPKIVDKLSDDEQSKQISMETDETAPVHDLLEIEKAGESKKAENSIETEIKELQIIQQEETKTEDKLVDSSKLSTDDEMKEAEKENPEQVIEKNDAEEELLEKPADVVKSQKENEDADKLSKTTSSSLDGHTAHKEVEDNNKTENTDKCLEDQTKCDTKTPEQILKTDNDGTSLTVIEKKSEKSLEESTQAIENKVSPNETVEPAEKSDGTAADATEVVGSPQKIVDTAEESNKITSDSTEKHESCKEISECVEGSKEKEGSVQEKTLETVEESSKQTKEQDAKNNESTDKEVELVNKDDEVVGASMETSESLKTLEKTSEESNKQENETKESPLVVVDKIAKPDEPKVDSIETQKSLKESGASQETDSIENQASLKEPAVSQGTDSIEKQESAKETAVSQESGDSKKSEQNETSKSSEVISSEILIERVETPKVATEAIVEKVREAATSIEGTQPKSIADTDLGAGQDAINPAARVDPNIIEIDDDDDDDIQEQTKSEDKSKKDEKAPSLSSEKELHDKKSDDVTKAAQNTKTNELVTPMDVDEELTTRRPAQKLAEQDQTTTTTNRDAKIDQESTVKDGNNTTLKGIPVEVMDDDEEPLLVIDTSHKEDNDTESNCMDNETATSAPTTDSSSDGSLEVFYDKECVNYECKRASKNFYRATVFAMNYFKVSKKRSKTQFVCEDCYDRSLSSYEDLCKTLKLKQPLLHGTTFKCQEFVEIIDSSDEDESDTAGADKVKISDENALPKESIEMLEAELEGAIRKVMHSVDIQNQLSWTKQILQQRLTNLQDDSEYVTEQLRTLQRKADHMHNSLYQCPKIKLRQLTPLDLNSGRMYNPESDNSTSIPLPGDIIRNPICVNEQYYAVKTKAIASWVPCKVIEEVEGYPSGYNQTKTYKIKFTKLAKYPMFKTVYAKHMAYYDPPNVRLPIGSRVIAYFDATSLSRGKEKMLIPSAFYPGIIAEPLKQSNKFRYLVFYDDGYFQYVNHKDVRLVCQASENVWEDVHHQSREFIHNYLTQYAVNRPMVQTQKGQSMLVDYNGKWIYARVIDVDCSLVQMLFEGQSRSEWIYRGSTRLGPVYKESNNLSQKNTLNATRRRTEPFIRYINGDDSSSSQQVQETPEQQPPAKSGSSEIRSVAKKSVSRVDTSNNNSTTSSSTAAQPVPTVRHLNNSTIFVDDDNKPKGKVVYYTARKNLPPRNYVPHICNPSCPFNITHNLSFYSPLAKPLLSGWERQVFRQKSKKFIVYRGPCGKRMRNIEELHRYLRVTDNELNVDSFDFSPDTNCLAEYVLEKCLVNKKDISCGKEKMPIPCVNYYDETMPPACEYSAERIPTKGVPLNLDEEFMCGCDCEDDCSDKTKCACWQLTYAGAKYGMPTVPTDMVGYQYKRLYEHVPTGIYECNSRCKCKSSCVNRVVQQPLQSKLQVFKTSNRGWGLRCINDVPRGSFICVYAGQMLTEQVANEGGLDAGDEYFAELDYIEVAEQIKEGYESDVQEPEEDDDIYNHEREDDDMDFRAPGESFKDKEFTTRLRARKGNKNSTDGEFDSQERQVISFEPNKTMDTSNEPNEKPTIRKLFGKDESCYVMDAKVRGNLGRYFNHSCSPNLFVQNVFVDTHDLRFPWVAFFASTHIRAGTELTWNYNYEVGVVPGKVLYCQCGAPNCRQRLL